MTTKEMLAEVIRRAVLKPREKEDLVDLWDRMHRYGKVSDKQKAWVEKVFFEKKLDRETPAVGTIRRRVIIPTWQKERRARQVDRAERPMETQEAVGHVPTMRLVPPIAAQLAGGAIQPSRIVAVKSTDIQAKLRAKGESPRAVPQPSSRPRPTSKSGTFIAVTPQKAHRIGYINYEGASQQLLITNMQLLHDHCPAIRPGTVQYQKIEKFFRDGGQVLKIKPAEASKVA
jgi:hypothetical protein